MYSSNMKILKRRKENFISLVIGKEMVESRFLRREYETSNSKK